MPRLLVGLADGVDLFELAGSVADLHPKSNTFPGEVFMGLAADALEIWWGADDYWRYALYAAVALIRASADKQGVPVARLV